jgi:hypothetical protein
MIQKIINLGGKVIADPPLPSLLTSMRAGASPKKSNETGAKPSLYASAKLGTSPKKSSQAPNQKLIDTMRGK